MKREIRYERGSGNVFADIGAANPEEALAKANIAQQVNRLISEKRLTQGGAAAILRIDQPRVSALSRGRLSVFSLEKLMGFAARLGNVVEITIRPAGGVLGSIMVKPPSCTIADKNRSAYGIAAMTSGNSYLRGEHSPVDVIASDEGRIPAPWLANNLFQNTRCLYRSSHA